MPRITPISFGGSGPGEREGEEDGDHDGGGGEDDAAGVGEPADRRLARVAGAVVVLLGRREQEHRVVHRDREDHREEEHGPPGVEEALRLEAEQARAVAVLEDQRVRRRTRRRWRAGSSATPSAAISGACRATSRSRKPSDEHDADDERRLRRERLLEVVVLGCGAADERGGRKRGSQPVDRPARARCSTDRSSGSPGSARARCLPPGPARRGRCPGRGAATADRRRAARRGTTIWSAPGAPVPNACCTCV